ncbi:MAG: hypothetical protein ACFFCL_06845 [Promethearchaeota archaeon]
MIFNSNTFLVAITIGLLAIALISLIMVIFEEFKEKSDDLFVIIGLIAIPIIFLIPLIIGLIQDLLKTIF